MIITVVILISLSYNNGVSYSWIDNDENGYDNNDDNVSDYEDENNNYNDNSSNRNDDDTNTRCLLMTIKMLIRITVTVWHSYWILFILLIGQNKRDTEVFFVLVCYYYYY